MVYIFIIVAANLINHLVGEPIEPSQFFFYSVLVAIFVYGFFIVVIEEDYYFTTETVTLKEEQCVLTPVELNAGKEQHEVLLVCFASAEGIRAVTFVAGTTYKHIALGTNETACIHIIPCKQQAHMEFSKTVEQKKRTKKPSPYFNLLGYIDYRLFNTTYKEKPKLIKKTYSFFVPVGSIHMRLE